MLALALVALVQAISVEPSPGRPNLSEDLYYASMSASGSRLCDRKRSARYRKLFERRYGERVRALLNAYDERYGPDPSFIITSSCRSSGAPGRKQNRDHAMAMNDFETWLRSAEQRFLLVDVR